MNNHTCNVKAIAEGWLRRTNYFLATCDCGWSASGATQKECLDRIARHYNDIINKQEDEMKVLEMVTRDDEITRRNEKNGKPMPYLDNTYGWQRKNLSPNTRYACCMIPIPECFRLATEEDVDASAVNMTECKCFTSKEDSQGGWRDREKGRYYDDIVYIVPIKSAKDTKIEALQARLKDAEAEVAKVRSELGAV